MAGFAQNGEADTMAPGPLLATVVHAVTGEDGKGLAGCADDQLVGIMSAAWWQAARDEWTLLAAMAEFARRHPGTSLEDEFAAEEVAFGLHLASGSAAGQLAYATAVSTQLPSAVQTTITHPGFSWAGTMIVHS